MIAIVFVLGAFCLVAIVAARYAPAGNVEAVVGGTAVFLFASAVVWVLLLMLHAIPIETIARRSFGLYDLQPWLGAVIYGPPIVGALAFAAALWRRSRRR